MRLPISLALGVAAVGALALAAPIREELADRRVCLRDSAEMTFYPSGQFLREASLGHRQLVADFGWLAAIQYYGKHRRSDHRYPLSPKLFSVILDADPRFERAYLFASLILAEAGFTARAERMLRRGVQANPGSWRLRFELGFFHYVISRNWEKAARAFSAAAEAPGAPAMVRRFAAAAHQKAGDRDTARELWEIVARVTDNPEIRRMAEERLAKLAEEGR